MINPIIEYSDTTITLELKEFKELIIERKHGHIWLYAEHEGQPITVDLTKAGFTYPLTRLILEESRRYDDKT